ncbi:MAG: acetyl-CoA acetyltransferase, partial [Actinomycetota bacterium]|nr:acetyl-CoA acetyltransferase [Actinomycetota bacterium]
MQTDIDGQTPIIVGVGQIADRVDDPGYRALSPIDLAVEAARAAVADTGADAEALIAAIDVVAATRQFEDSTPGAPAPLGKSSKFTLSVANRLGAKPRRAVLEIAGGQSPQHLVTEFSREIAGGCADVVVLTGAEAISTIGHLAKSDDKPDFSDDPDDPEGVFEDRGFGLKGLVTLEQIGHGLINAPVQYGLLENARRSASGQSRAEYAEAMGELFAPFTEIAAANPLAAAREVRSAAELVTATERNRLIAEPYTRFLVARDLVNLAAAVVLTSVATARRLGIAEDKWVYLHGQAELRERNLFERNDLGGAPSAATAVRHALEVAESGIDDVDFFDFYSCFPIAVSNSTEALGLSAHDPRGLTLTGGLPYFGGPGNNYSMHAIAEAVERVRARPGSRALVSANGGVLSKTSVGIYSTTPSPLRQDASATLQAEIDARQAPRHAPHPNGWATIETFTVEHTRKGKNGIVIGRLAANGDRFLALVAPEDAELMDLLQTADDPVGQSIYVTALGHGNRVTVSEDRAADLFAKRPPGLRESYEFITVQRDGRILEVTINRPNLRNCLHPPAHE